MLARKACARTRGPEGSRPGARQLVGRGSPSPPLNRESLETYRRFVCRSANGGLGEPALPKAAVSLKGGSIGEPDDWLGTYIFRSQVSADRASGTGYQVRVRVRGLNLYIVLNTRTRDLTAETWDLRMVLLQLCRDAVPTHPREHLRLCPHDNGPSLNGGLGHTFIIPL
jgi:hypothetical protein